MPIGCMKNKVYGLKAFVYEMRKKDKEILKNSENSCNSKRSGGGQAILVSEVPMESMNNKVYGWKTVDYGLSENDKEKHENAMFPNES